MLALRTVSSSTHAIVRITPGHEKTGTNGPVSPHTRRYTPCMDSLSRPIVGHTPRKLPRFRAISRIIADCARNRRSAIIQQHPRVCQGLFQNFFGIFHEVLGGVFVHYILGHFSIRNHKDLYIIYNKIRRGGGTGRPPIFYCAASGMIPSCPSSRAPPPSRQARV